MCSHLDNHPKYHNIQIKPTTPNTDNLVEYATPGSAGMDIRANIKQPLELDPGTSVLVPAGFSIKLPQGTAALLLPRSGLASEYGVTLANSPGLIDCDYRGEIKVALRNESVLPYTIYPGSRIAQMVIIPYYKVKIEVTDELDETERGHNGFGSTGVM